MVSAYTPNIQLEEPARGDQVGTWDTPVNNNMTLIDSVVGGAATIAVGGAGIVLAAAQFQSKTIVFSSTLTASITVTFPTSFAKSYEIYNQATGSSNFTITLKTTGAGTFAICAPPGEFVDVALFSPGNLFFKNIGRVGSYWDHGGSSVPNWVSGCTIPPYLLCDGTAFSSATYPNLRNYLGGANTPDARGRARYTLDAGTARLTGVMAAGNTLLAGDGDQFLATHTHINVLNDPGHTHGTTAISAAFTAASGADGPFPIPNGAGATIAVAGTGMTITNAPVGTGGSQNLPPLFIGGITMIRAG